MLLYASLLVILLAIGLIVYIFDVKSNYFPVPMMLLVIGLGLSFIPVFNRLSLNHDIIFDLMLPAILFVSAYSFPIRSFKKNFRPIATLGTLGLMATVFFMAVLIYLVGAPFAGLSFVAAFLIASILTPTDPVSVTAILENVFGDSDIPKVVEGESMINDGTSVVLFSIASSMFLYNESFSILSFLGEFLLVSLGGVAVGVAGGWLVTKAVHIMHNHVYQVMLSVILAYGGFYIAEGLGTSGVLATVSAGIMLSRAFQKSEKEEELHSYLDGFWKVVEPAVLSLLFLLIGIQAASYLAFGHWLFAIGIFMISLIVRFLVLGGFLKLSPHINERFQWSSVFMMTWSGLKGTVSVALLLSIETQSSSSADLIVSLTFAAILLSLVIQSLGVYPLAQKFAS
ncbi:cation:proton antiporter [Marinococcus halotolerans]|uniref:cation:proton antiporter n=1 Tax=Marinococcus halotolerans TaxID=301092 RepID=UPI0003B6C824|nr:sodium:proton antiporter [Marinococcus halotolerans]